MIFESQLIFHIMNTQQTQLKGVLLLLLTAFIWGTSFVSQSVGMEKIDAFTFNGIRTLLGAAFLLPIIIIKDCASYKKADAQFLANKRRYTKEAIRKGAILSIPFFIATNLQQFAFYYSTSGKIAFITAIYMLFVPILGIVLKKRIPKITWICIIMGFVGLYLLCIDSNNLGNINTGDLLALGCAFFFAIHILLIEKFSPDVDGTKLSCTQFAIGGTMSCICMFIFENPNLEDILSVISPIMYSGIMSCGVAYTLQIIGQKYTEATIASLLMCAESVFAVIAGALFLHEVMIGREIIGCIVMFSAIILSQLSPLLSKSPKNNHQ